MANPFLMDDDLDGGDVAVNPFLMQSDPEPGESENPFGETASNPFAFGGDDGGEPVETAEPVADIDAAMSFFGTTIEAEDDALSLKSAAEEDDDGKKGTAAPPPRPQPPQSTQDLISTVSSQLDETSSELLGRIPATRSPSPVSMRDLHSPSPTPDSGLADLLDVDISDSGSSAHTQAIEADLMGAAPMAPSPLDNPFGVPTAVPNLQGAAPIASPAKQQPPRPPPPRPVPPRPTPPAAHMMQGHGQQQPAPPQRPPPPAAPAATTAADVADADDLLDMFGTGNGASSKPAKPPPPKTKEDILSLFEQPSTVAAPASAAAAAAQPDLLNDDLPDAQSREDPIFSSLLIRPDDSTHDITSQPQAATLAHIAPPPETAQRQRAPTPDIEITTVEDLPRSDDEEEPEPAQAEPQQQEPEPEAIEEPLVLAEQPEPEPELELQVEPDQPIAVESDQSPPTESAATTQAAQESGLDLGSDEPEQMDTGLDFPGLASGQLSANPFASPEGEEDEPSFAPAPIVSNIFAVDEPDVEPVPEVLPRQAPPPVPAPPAAAFAGNIFAAEPDEFDAFSAKFDSVKKDNISILDGFGGGGSGAITPTGGDGKWRASQADLLEFPSHSPSLFRSLGRQCIRVGADCGECLRRGEHRGRWLWQ